MLGHRFDTICIAPLIKGVEFGALLANNAFDSNEIIAELNERGAKIVISQHPRCAILIGLDTEMYKWRHLIEKILLYTQRVRTHHHARMQNRSEL